VNRVLFVCTGNAARSVIAGAVLEAWVRDGGVQVEVRTAGTHALAGQPIGRRTRQALESVGIDPPAHRSHQLVQEEAEWADVIVVMEPAHVSYVRCHYPLAAARTATLPYLVSRLAPPGVPLAERISALGLDSVALEDEEEVPDPAGGEDDDYLVCARTVSELTLSLAPRLV
jgi:protein-tyrosine phosphatase